MSNKTEHYSRLQLEKMIRRPVTIPQHQTIRKLALELLQLRYGQQKAETETILKAEKESWSYQQLADALGITEGAARQRAERLHVNLNRLKKRWTTEEDALLLKLAKQGAGLKETHGSFPDRTFDALKARRAYVMKKEK